MKCLWIILTKKCEKLCPENLKTLLREIEDLNKWRDMCVHGSEHSYC